MVGIDRVSAWILPLYSLGLGLRADPGLRGVFYGCGRNEGKSALKSFLVGPLMKLCRTMLLIFGIAAFVSASAAPYDEEPFRTSVMEPARVLVESAGINNWLNANYSRMTPGQIQGAREHLHVLIDSRIKELYAVNRVLLPNKADPILAMLYAWAGRLGVYGSDLVYAALRGTYPVSPPPGPRPPDGLAVALERDSLVISSSVGGWRASVPFHFFIFMLNNGVGPDLLRTEAVVISTGSGSDTADPGYSQATLAVFFTEGADMKVFEPQWAERLQMPPHEAQSTIANTNYRSRKAYDGRTRLHKEIVLIPSRKGAFAILYSGLDGTYQLNRPHFVSFLDGLRLPE